MAIIGEQLLNPEQNWTRIDDSDKNFFNYNGSWNFTTTNNFCYKRTVSNNNDFNSNVDFSFKGIGLRIIIYKQTGSQCETVEVNVDGNLYYYNGRAYDVGASVSQCLVFELVDLKNEIHNVSIKAKDGSTYSRFFIDAVDIKNAVIADIKRNTVIASNIYEDDNVIRKDYIGILENCTLSNVDVLETINIVSNNEVQQMNIKTVFSEQFILE